MNKKRSRYIFIALVLCLTAALAGGCRNGAAGKVNVESRDMLYQVSTIDALLNGLYYGIQTFGQLEQHGDMGLGTFADLDGEMVGLDGAFYQVKMDGKAYRVADDMLTPFSCVTFFDNDIEQEVPAGTGYSDLEAFIDGLLPTENIFYAVMIEGRFSHMKTRSVPAQEKPYPPLAEVTPHQDIEGFCRKTCHPQVCRNLPQSLPY